MKIVLPLAGKGKRLLPHTNNIPKPLMFVAGASILDHLLKELVPLNSTEFVFITGYLQDQIKEHMQNHYPHLSVRFIEQKNPQGLGHAIYQARDAFAKDEDMLVVLGDQTFTVDWDRMLNKTHNRISVVPVEDPSSFGVVVLGQDDLVQEMEEKPENPKSNLAISGTYYFSSAQSVFSTIAHQIAKDIRTRGEIQITDTMRIMMNAGEKFEVLEISDWNDCGNHEDLLNANTTLLNRNCAERPIFDETVTIIEPVYIHHDVVLSNSVIGPNVSLAAGVVVCDSNLSHSVVDQNTTVVSCEFVSSYIGRDLSLQNLNESSYYKA